MSVSLILEISVVIVYVIVMFHMLRQKYVYVTLLVAAGLNFISGAYNNYEFPPRSMKNYFLFSF